MIRRLKSPKSTAGISKDRKLTETVEALLADVAAPSPPPPPPPPPPHRGA